MQEIKLTDEQKKKLTKLRWSTCKNGAFIGLKYTSLMLLSSFFVVVVDAIGPHSGSFRFVASIISCIFIIGGWRKDLTKEYDRVKEEVQKILEQ